MKGEGKCDDDGTELSAGARRGGQASHIGMAGVVDGRDSTVGETRDSRQNPIPFICDVDKDGLTRHEHVSNKWGEMVTA